MVGPEAAGGRSTVEGEDVYTKSYGQTRCVQEVGVEYMYSIGSGDILWSDQEHAGGWGTVERCTCAHQEVLDGPGDCR